MGMLPFVVRLFCQLAAMYNHFLFIFGKMYIELARASQEDFVLIRSLVWLHCTLVYTIQYNAIAGSGTTLKSS